MRMCYINLRFTDLLISLLKWIITDLIVSNPLNGPQTTQLTSYRLFFYGTCEHNVGMPGCLWQYVTSHCHVEGPRHVECRQVNRHLAVADSSIHCSRNKSSHEQPANPIQTNDCVPDPNWPTTASTVNCISRNEVASMWGPA